MYTRRYPSPRPRPRPAPLPPGYSGTALGAPPPPPEEEPRAIPAPALPARPLEAEDERDGGFLPRRLRAPRALGAILPASLADDDLLLLGLMALMLFGTEGGAAENADLLLLFGLLFFIGKEA